ncbi:hypothetical protein BH09SUM1_BH09SUM1_29320 [soil metagenome]
MEFMRPILLPEEFQQVCRGRGEFSSDAQTGVVTLKTGKKFNVLITHETAINAVEGHRFSYPPPFGSGDIANLEITNIQWWSGPLFDNRSRAKRWLDFIGHETKRSAAEMTSWRHWLALLRFGSPAIVGALILAHCANREHDAEIERQIRTKPKITRLELRVLKKEIGDASADEAMRMVAAFHKDHYGNKYRAIATSDSLTLYSMGPDQIDQQGVLLYDPTNGIDSGGDIVYTPP